MSVVVVLLLLAHEYSAGASFAALSAAVIC